MKNKETEIYSQMKIIESFKDINPINLIEQLYKKSTNKEKEAIKSFFTDAELLKDLHISYQFFTKNFKSKNLQDFFMNCKEKSENNALELPSFNNRKKLLKFILWIQKIADNNEIPKYNIIGRKKILEDFDIDYDTLNQWLIYFGKEEYIGRRAFSSDEYALIIKDFITTDNVIIFENLEYYHFRTFNKIRIAEIIGDLTKSEKTNYDKLWKKSDYIDDHNPENKRLLDWIKKHHKMPFSLAYQWISLIIKEFSKSNHLEVSEVFKLYFTNR